MPAFELQIDGQAHQASWELGDCDRLTVKSAFGSTYAYPDGRDPQTLAQSLLRQLICRAGRLAG